MDADATLVDLQTKGQVVLPLSMFTYFWLKSLSRFYGKVHDDRVGIIGSVKWWVFVLFRRTCLVLSSEAHAIFVFLAQHQREIAKWGFIKVGDRGRALKLVRTKGIRFPSVPPKQDLKLSYFRMRHEQLEKELGAKIEFDNDH